ncbi:MAG: 4-hydroxythreonine-4-phosphate dehydrogenase PdxA [Mogibacterium sp.]|nr:4-hydroxythreonine-4-phosphate dehydrogenase PdxA [Mogibacterium sp.]
MDKPLIAVTMGDPAGIGPEIVARTVADKDLFAETNCIVIGDAQILEEAIAVTGADLRINIVEAPESGDYSAGVLNLIDLDNVDMGRFRYGEISAMCGRAAFEYIEKATQITMEGKADAISTAPINKEALRAAGVDFIGHTEIFGKLTNTNDPLAMFETCGMRIFFLTRHVSMRAMVDMITKERVIDYVERCTEALARLGVTEGTMAVAGLNPHSGEHGLFGWEEVSEIVPAVEDLRSRGYDVTGPESADTVFHHAAIGRFSAVLSLYHDQGHIAAKTLDFDRTVEITNSMPILRTSAAHGTAFDIAGKGIAEAVGMAEAVRIAAKYAPHFTGR